MKIELTEAEQRFVDFCVMNKEQTVRDADFAVKGSDDVAPVIELHDDDGPIGMVFCRMVDRDPALDAIWRYVPALSATTVMACFDAHMSHEQMNPSTGKPWGPNEMQHACDAEGACATGVITATLTIVVARKVSPLRHFGLPYHVNAVLELAALAAAEQA